MILTAAFLDRLDAITVEHSACVDCGQPVNDQGTGGWIHTATGYYACAMSPGTGRGSQAHPYHVDSEDERDSAINAAVEAEVEAWKEVMHDDDELADAKADSYDEGREDVFKAVANALKYAKSTHTNVLVAVQAVLDGAS